MRASDPDETDELGYRPLHAALAPDTYAPGYQESDGFNLAASLALIERGAVDRHRVPGQWH